MKGFALVTGAARRIGKAIATGLAADGWSVVLHASDRSFDQANELAGKLGQTGVKTVAIAGDLSEPGSADRLIRHACEAIQQYAMPLSLLVNNASVFEPDSATDIDPGRWDRHFAVNLRAPVMLSSAFAKACVEHRQRDASIVNIIDQRVWRLNPHYFTYTLTKSALWTATQTLAQTLAPDIRVNAVGPGPVLPNVNEGEDGFHREASNVPLERAVSPEEIADAVVWLAQAHSITGQMICVDGGQHLAWKTPDVAG